MKFVLEIYKSWKSRTPSFGIGFIPNPNAEEPTWVDHFMNIVTFIMIPLAFVVLHLLYFITIFCPIMASLIDNLDVEYMRDGVEVKHHTFDSIWGWIFLSSLYVFSFLFFVAYLKLKSINIKSKNILREGQDPALYDLCSHCKDVIKSEGI